MKNIDFAIHSKEYIMDAEHQEPFAYGVRPSAGNDGYVKSLLHGKLHGKAILHVGSPEKIAIIGEYYGAVGEYAVVIEDKGSNVFKL
jgi:hypothetical protein